MNINTLNDIIGQFETEIINSAFKRDLQDYVNSLPNNQNNIVSLREIANKVFDKLDEVYNTDLPDNLIRLLPDKIKPFTQTAFNEKLKEIIEDKAIDLSSFFQKLNQILNQINNEIQKNIAEIEKIKAFLKPYIESKEEELTTENTAIVSIVFKHEKTITDLKEFTKNLHTWNKIVPVYHQILSSTSPEDIKIVNVQNGSIDFLINLNFDFAINLAEIFEVGFRAFLTYLSYKKMIKPIVEGYLGNKKLIEGEKEREKELINNIGEAVKHKILEQHKKAIKSDKAIDKNIDKKVEEVVKLVTSHILKGNDLKLIAIPEIVETNEEESEEIKVQELRRVSTQVKQAVKTLPQSEMKQLLEKYKSPDENIEN